MFGSNQLSQLSQGTIGAAGDCILMNVRHVVTAPAAAAPTLRPPHRQCPKRRWLQWRLDMSLGSNCSNHRWNHVEIMLKPQKITSEWSNMIHLPWEPGCSASFLRIYRLSNSCTGHWGRWFTSFCPRIPMCCTCGCMPLGGANPIRRIRKDMNRWDPLG